jgi:hypothetical protein
VRLSYPNCLAEDLKKVLASLRVGIYYPDGPDFNLLPP